tara:strand:+ start:2728 stop:3027 length:300 start_codon:yes stop_codon:yes gene_type:complete
MSEAKELQQQTADLLQLLNAANFSDAGDVEQVYQHFDTTSFTNMHDQHLENARRMLVDTLGKEPYNMADLQWNIDFFRRGAGYLFPELKKDFPEINTET